MDVGIEQKLHWLLMKWWLVFRASWPRMLLTGKFLRERKEEKIKENKREKEIREEKSKEEKRGCELTVTPGGKSSHTGVLVYFLRNNILSESCRILWERTQQASCENVESPYRLPTSWHLCEKGVTLMRKVSEERDGFENAFWLLWTNCISYSLRLKMALNL